MYFTINGSPVISGVDSKVLQTEMMKLLEELWFYTNARVEFDDIPGFEDPIIVYPINDGVRLCYKGRATRTEVFVDSDENFHLYRLHWSEGELQRKEEIKLVDGMIPNHRERTSEQAALFGAFKRAAHQYAVGNCQ